MNKNPLNTVLVNSTEEFTKELTAQLLGKVKEYSIKYDVNIIKPKNSKGKIQFNVELDDTGVSILLTDRESIRREVTAITYVIKNAFKKRSKRFKELSNLMVQFVGILPEVIVRL